MTQRTYEIAVTGTAFLYRTCTVTASSEAEAMNDVLRQATSDSETFWESADGSGARIKDIHVLHETIANQL